MHRDIEGKNLSPRQKLRSKLAKKQVTINLDEDTINYFKMQSEIAGLPYQTLINLYLRDCVAQKRQLEITWK